jgi:hypothetical protein
MIHLQMAWKWGERLTFIFSLNLDLRFFVYFQCEFSSYVAEVGQFHSRVLQPFLRLLELVIRELQLAKQIADSFCFPSPREQMAECMDRENDLREVLLLIKIQCLKNKTL